MFLSATVVDNNVSLNWKTATELNNKGFEIERKSGEGSWNKVFISQVMELPPHQKNICSLIKV
ncbi:MAG: hypothetical protein IPG53_11980 [Ignavibacteriales bacterium]|nr:hypothetical protein [Ignavibacteriales bacterium]